MRVLVEVRVSVLQQEKGKGPASVIASIQFAFADGSVHRFAVDGNTTDLPALISPLGSFYMDYKNGEHLVCVRGNVHRGRIVGLQLQSSNGRRSPWYGDARGGGPKRGGTRLELYASASSLSTAIIGLDIEVVENALGLKGIVEGPAPRPISSKKSIMSLMLSRETRTTVLRRGGPERRSLLGAFLRGGSKSITRLALSSGLRKEMLRKGPNGSDSLLRMFLTQERVTFSPHDADLSTPRSFFATLAFRGNTYKQSLLELMLKESVSIPSLLRMFFDKTESNGQLSVVDRIFRKPSAETNSLARLFFAPDARRGLRSLIQLMTDGELLDDAARPSILRLALEGEDDDSSSVLRLMCIRPANGVTVLESLLISKTEEDDNSVRRLITTGALRGFLTDTPTGKPAIAKFLFAGGPEKSTAGLMLAGERRDQNSLLRLLGPHTPGQLGIIDLLSRNTPSLIEICLSGESSSSETSLARVALSKTFRIAGGRLVTGRTDVGASNQAGLVETKAENEESNDEEGFFENEEDDEAEANMLLPTLLDSSSVRVLNARKSVSKRSSVRKSRTSATNKHLSRADLAREAGGMTLASAFMKGEESGGPGISLMRAVLLGEGERDPVTNAPGTSILRLLLTGEETGETSPLRILLTGSRATMIPSDEATSSKIKQAKGVGTTSATSYVSKWGETLRKITTAVTDSVEDSTIEGHTFREAFADLVALGKTAAWSVMSEKSFIWAAFARLSSLGPAFAAQWSTQWARVARELRMSGIRTAASSTTSRWPALANRLAEVSEQIGSQSWRRVLAKLPGVMLALERAMLNKPRGDSMVKSEKVD